jgi:hypothetical protein
MLTITQQGSFDHLEAYVVGLSKKDLTGILDSYGPSGENALSNATPVDTGLTSESWYYVVEVRPGYHSLRWHNSDIENGFPVAVMLQYGHGTKNGGYVEGRDYIMPAIRPIFDIVEADVWKEVIA